MVEKNVNNIFSTYWQIGIVIRAARSGHLPNYGFVFVSLGSTAVLLIAIRALLYALLPVDNSKKSDVYRRGSPFELFEVHNLFIFVSSYDVVFLIQSNACINEYVIHYQKLLEQELIVQTTYSHPFFIIDITNHFACRLTIFIMRNLFLLFCSFSHH